MMKKTLLTLFLLLFAAETFAYNFKVDGIYYNKLSDGKSVMVTFEGRNSFSYMGSVTIPDEVTYDNVTSSVKTIGDDAFSNCTGLTSVTIPNSVTSIGDKTFVSCTGLTSVTIPNSFTTIGADAFSNCTGLTSVTIPNSVTSIGYFAFSNCTGLTSVTIGNSVTSIGYDAFYDCTGLTSIDVNEKNTKYSSINGILFNKDQSTIIYYPARIKSQTYEIPNSVTSIGANAFSNCTGLTSVTIPNSVTSIGDDAFSYCTGLTSVTIPNSVTSIGANAFSNCSGLTSVTIANSVTSIGDDAFLYCTGLTSIDVNENNTKYSSINGILFNKDQSTIICYPARIKSQTYEIPNSVTSIGAKAFSYCSGLTSVTIPNSVTSIGADAFYDCRGLTSVTIPNSVTSIGAGAFSNCYRLTSVTMGNSVTSIGAGGFSDTPWYNNQPDGLMYIYNVAYKYKGTMPDNTSIILKDGTVSITDGAFSDCKGLTSVTIPNSVTSIGSMAFIRCTNLTSLNSYITDPSKVMVGEAIFYQIPTSTCILHVPAGTKSLYQAADQWKVFLNIVEDLSTGITATTATDAIRYSVSGSTINLSGLTDGEVVSFYTVAGMTLGTVKAVGSEVNFDTGFTNQVIIVRIGESSIKVSL